MATPAVDNGTANQADRNVRPTLKKASSQSGRLPGGRQAHKGHPCNAKVAA